MSASRKKKSPAANRKKRSRLNDETNCPRCHRPLAFRSERRFLDVDDTSDLSEGQLAEYMAAEMSDDSDNFHETVKVGSCPVHGDVMEEGEDWSALQAVGQVLSPSFSVVEIACRLNSKREPITKVTFQFDKDDLWKHVRDWCLVSNVTVEYPGNPRHAIGDEVSDIVGSMRKLLNLA